MLLEAINLCQNDRRQFLQGLIPTIKQMLLQMEKKKKAEENHWRLIKC